MAEVKIPFMNDEQRLQALEREVAYLQEQVCKLREEKRALQLVLATQGVTSGFSLEFFQGYIQQALGIVEEVEGYDSLEELKASTEEARRIAREVRATITKQFGGLNTEVEEPR